MSAQRAAVAGQRRPASASRTPVPPGWRRFLRQPVRVTAVALLAATALAAGGIQAGAAAALQSSVAANWRGAYDVLVTADPVTPVGNVLPPNTLGSDTGMTLAELDRIRAIPGVEIAAPIGQVLVPDLVLSPLRLAIPAGLAGTAEAPQAYRADVTYTTDDGLGERLVASDEVTLVVDETDASDALKQSRQACLDEAFSGSSRAGFESFTYSPADYPALTRYACSSPGRWDVPPLATAFLSGTGRLWTSLEKTADDREAYVLSLPVAPVTATRITLVDPVAERALLGDAGSFLDPLVAAAPGPTTDTAQMFAWASAAGGEFARRFLESDVGRAASGEGSTVVSDMPPDAVDDLRRLFAANGADWDAFDAKMRTEASPAAPILVSKTPTAKLSVKVALQGFGDAPRQPADASGHSTGYELPQALTLGAPGAQLGVSVTDASDQLNPFREATTLVQWPGGESNIESAETSRPLYLMRTLGAQKPEITDGEQLVLASAGYANATTTFGSGDPTIPVKLSPAGDGVGYEAAYTGLRKAGGELQSSIFAVPVGSFDAAAVEASGAGAQAASYVPLGAYAPVGARLTNGEHAGTEMAPSVSGLGLVSSRTAAIASIASAAQWRDKAPIEAVRVRVAGIEGYTDAARQRVVDVAAALESAGFNATIVAGSSPTEVELRVDDYAFGTMDAAGTQNVGVLGMVAQQWSELGAASRASLAISNAMFITLGIALGSAVLLLAGVGLVVVPARREEAALMREMGIAKREIRRWFAAEEWPALAFMGAVAVLAAVLSGGRALTFVAAGVAVAAIAVSSLVSVWAGARTRPLGRRVDARSTRLGATSVAAFGARQVLVHPLAAALHAASIVIVSLASAALVAAVFSGYAEAGSSRIATLLLAQQLAPQLVLGLAGIGGGVALARLARARELDRRREQWRALRAAGWTTWQLRRAQRVEGALVAVPAVLAAIVIALASVSLLAAPDAGETSATAPALALAAAAGVGGIIAMIAASSAGGQYRPAVRKRSSHPRTLEATSGPDTDTDTDTPNDRTGGPA